MTDKSNFAPDEWKLLLESVMTAGIAVTAADPSGLWGLLKESFASGTELAKAKMDPGTNTLIKAVVNDFGSSEGRSAARDDLKSKLTGSKPAEIKDKCIETLRQATAVIDAKAPGDAAAFKGWLRQISQHVAEGGSYFISRAEPALVAAAWWSCRGASFSALPFGQFRVEIRLDQCWNAKLSSPCLLWQLLARTSPNVCGSAP